MRTLPVGFGTWGEGSTVIAFDGRMPVFAFAAALLATLVFSAAPVLGVLAGAAGAAALGRFLASLLYGVTAYDPLAVAGVLAALVAASLAAVWPPARRAARLDPASVLRAE